MSTPYIVVDDPYIPDGAPEMEIIHPETASRVAPRIQEIFRSPYPEMLVVFGLLKRLGVRRILIHGDPKSVHAIATFTFHGPHAIVAYRKIPLMESLPLVPGEGDVVIKFRASALMFWDNQYVSLKNAAQGE